MSGIVKRSLSGIMLLVLAGCFHAELNGPVVGGSVTITELRSGAIAQEGLATFDDDAVIALFGQDVWDDLDDLGRFINLGNFFVDGNSFADDELYLVTVSGGMEVDANADGVTDENPAPVAGSWHLVIKGSQLIKGGFMVSAISEALYQSVKDDIPQLSDADLMVRLNKNTRLILGDVNQSGKVNYTDALAWTELLYINQYLLDYDAVSNLSDAITAGASASDISQLAMLVMGQEPTVDAQQFFNDNISMQIVQRKCIACHVGGGQAPSRGAELIFVSNSNPDHLSINHRAFVQFPKFIGSRDLSDYVTGKAGGTLGHGGGRQLTPGSQELIDLETYLELIE